MAFPPQKKQPVQLKANTDPKGADAQDKLDAMHKGAHKSVKAQRDTTHEAGKKGFPLKGGY